MDEARTVWLDWIGRNAPYVFWTVWGAGIGAFGAVLFSAVSVGGEILRIYLGILTVMMGGALGLVSSRAMDHYSDRRKVRRKILVALVRMQNLIFRLRRLHHAIDPKTYGGLPLGDAKHLSLDNLQSLSVEIRNAHIAASPRPEFEELIDNSEDARWANRVTMAYDYAEHRPRYPETLMELSAEDRREFVTTAVGSDLMPNALDLIITTLLQASQHWATRVGQDSPFASLPKPISSIQYP